MSLTRADVIAYLGALDALALGELVDQLQHRLGLPPPMQPAPFTMGAPLTTMGMPIEESCHSVVLVGFTDSRKVELLRLVRELRPIGLLEAKRLIESAPVTLLEDASPHQANTLATRLREAGALVEIR
jgi:large subunit ribosomal protein L7/L12